MDKEMNEIKKPKNPPETIDLIASLMRERRFNPSSFALVLGKSRQWGYAFMKNQIKLSLPLLLDIAKILAVTPESLIPKQNGFNQKEGFEEYVRRICREEIKKEKNS